MRKTESLLMRKNESLLTNKTMWQAVLILWYLTQGGKAIAKLKTPVVKETKEKMRVC